MTQRMQDFIYRECLAVLWSAGHAVSPGLKRKLEDAAPLEVTQRIYCTTEEQRAAILSRVLRQCGFATIDGAAFPELLPSVAHEFRATPNAGHAVRLTGEWCGLKPGAVLILSGRRFRDGSFSVGTGRHYWEDDTERDSIVSLSSGGPSSMLRLPAAALERTDESAPVWFWRFSGEFPPAHTGVDYLRHMPLWQWSGKESDFETHKES